MSKSARTAILDAYRIAKPHLMDELPDNMPVVLLVRFRLGDLRQLEREPPTTSDGATKW